MRIFVRNLRGRRLALKRTQECAARLALIDPTYWSRVERGKIEPGMRMAARMAYGVDSTLRDLLEDGQASESPPNRVAPDVMKRLRRAGQMADALNLMVSGLESELGDGQRAARNQVGVVEP